MPSEMSWILRSGSPREIGGKAAALAALRESGASIPAWFAIRVPHADAASETLPNGLGDELQAALRELARDGDRLAVRSSASEEDGAEHSFAGQYDSYLYV